MERSSETGAKLRRVRLLYFAWVREKIGRGEEVVELPDDAHTVADLITWLRSRGPEYKAAFLRPQTVRAAVDKAHVKPDASIRGAAEIAFFPPVTGG